MPIVTPALPDIMPGTSILAAVQKVLIPIQTKPKGAKLDPKAQTFYPGGKISATTVKKLHASPKSAFSAPLTPPPTPRKMIETPNLHFESLVIGLRASALALK